MAHAGTPTDLAKQPATSTVNGLWQALLVAMVLLAVVAGTVFVGTNLAAKNAVVPAADHSYDQIEAQRGAAVFAPAADGSYDQIEKSRAGTITAPVLHYPDVTYDQNNWPGALSTNKISGTAPDNRPGRIKGHRGAMIDQ